MQIFYLNTTFQGRSQCMKGSQGVLISQACSALTLTVCEKIRHTHHLAAWGRRACTAPQAWEHRVQLGSFAVDSWVYPLTSLDLRSLKSQNIQLDKELFCKRKEKSGQAQGNNTVAVFQNQQMLISCRIVQSLAKHQTQLKSLYSPPCAFSLSTSLKAITNMVDQYLVHLCVCRCVCMCLHAHILPHLCFCVCSYTRYITERAYVQGLNTAFGTRWPRFKSQM